VLIASWNINSVRHRLPVLRRFLRKYNPDVLCLQETKVADELFPVTFFERVGLQHLAFVGQKAYHGVAIASRIPFSKQWSRTLYRMKEARHVAVAFASFDLELHNMYFPAGGDDPRPDRNPKFARKLGFFRSATRWMKRWDPSTPRMLVGDLNVAPLETDVWSHAKLRRTITHTEIEIDHLQKMQRAQRWVDVAREFVPPEEKLFTWWSYRAPDFRKANKGRRLDHIWVTPPLEAAVRSFQVSEEVRGWKSPSDHAPVLCELSPPG
jgi:exodeoxyribonuclease-3